MNNKLILIRHSIPELIPSVPPNKWLLNAAGKEQAYLLARQVSTHSIDIIMSIKEPKAIETALSGSQVGDWCARYGDGYVWSQTFIR